MSRSNHSLPWVNRKLKKSLKKKARMYKQAKKTGSWSQYKYYQKQCKREFRKAEYEHINNTIQEGLDTVLELRKSQKTR